MAYTIYLRTNKTNGMQYVGQTDNFNRRERCWKCLKGEYANRYIDEDRNKYGLDNFNVVIIDHCETQEEAYELEQKFIKELGTKYPNGYNMGDGGKGSKNKYISGDTRLRMSKAFKGRKLSEETRQKMSKTRKGRRRSEEHIRNNSEAVKKPILQIDKKTNEIVVKWKSATDIEKELGYCNSAICHCCKGKQKTAYGYIWRYA